jgi:hypothetical protein
VLVLYFVFAQQRPKSNDWCKKRWIEQWIQ